MSTIVTLGLVALAACGGIDNNNGDGTTSDGGSTTNPTETGTLVVHASFLGEGLTNAPLVIDGTPSHWFAGDVIELGVGNHVVNLGVKDPTTGLYLHQLSGWQGDEAWADATVFTGDLAVTIEADAETMVDGDPETEEIEPIALDLYPVNAQSWWTCVNDGDSYIATGEIETDTDTIDLVVVKMTIDGINIECSGAPEDCYGAFTTPSTAVFVSTVGDMDVTYTCGASTATGQLL